MISLPPLEEVKIQRERREETVQEYRVGKRDSYVIVAQLSPEFTARLVNRRQELENIPKRAAFGTPATRAESDCRPATNWGWSKDALQL